MKFWLLLCVLICVAMPCSGGAERGQPNVLFIIVDDLNCRVGCYGDPVAKTPHLDRLAGKGVLFERAYCNFPLCNPTRSSVMSGQFPTTTGVLDNKTWLVPPPGHPTLPQHFESHGWMRGEFGKVWHEPQNNGQIDFTNPPDSRTGNLGYTPAQQKLWYTAAQRKQQQAAEPEFWTHAQNYDHYRADPPPAEQVQRLRNGPNVFGPVPAGPGTPDIAHADGAIQFLQSQDTSGQPFFLAVGFQKPHVPLKAPQEFFELYTAETLPLPPDFANEPTLPSGASPLDTRRNLDLYADRSFTAHEARAALHAYYACVSYIDAQLGRVLDALEATGEMNNTLIVLWGDHGWHLSEKGFFAKGTLFEVAIRAPLIIVDPRRDASAGRTCRRIVQFLDIYPTLADLAGLPLPPALEGVSLRPLLDDPAAVWDRPAFTVQSRGWSLGRRIRTERWAYSQWNGEDQGGAMLFDHNHDPHELNNLAHDPAYAEVVTTLKSQLRRSPIAAMPGPEANDP